MEASMISRNQVVDRDTTHVAREVVEIMTITNINRVVADLIVMLTSNNAAVTMMTVIVVVILVGVIGVKEMIDAGQVEEVIVTAGEEVVGSSQKVEATAAEITTIMMTIIRLDACRGSHLL